MISTTSSETTASETTASPLITAATALDSDPQWYKDAVIYELHVRSFCDSNADGIGDFPGLTEKLEYLKGLGVTALWLLPFYPSPLRDDGYDISDYFGINPAYGTLKDFKRFLRKAHSLGLRVITELVVNHTSNEHAWFQRARRAPAGSRLRDFYVWSDTSKKYEEARIIFKDFETSNWSWDPVAQAYYWHRFYSHQPDLNFDNPAVHEALFKALDFWLGLGVDGMRLDAVPYLYEREGTNCENLSETHEFLRKLRAHIDSKFSGRMLLAEANQWPEDAAAYFGKGDECHMNFHFPLMPRIFMAVQLEDSFPIRDILEQTPPIPETCQWATFLRNHDELTLEMVTDEDRDYMYRVYADDPRARINLGIRRRLAPLLRMRRKVELLNSLLFSLPGTPVLYYGDEIGMGDNIYLGDRNGVRTPMQWSSDRNAGFSRANPQQLYFPVITDPEYHYEATNVEANENNPESLLWWMKRLIDLRKSHRVLGRGDVQVLHLENPKVLAFVRRYENQRLLIVTNLSRSAQYAELDLKEYAGLTPVELFGRQAFPVLDERPLFLSLGPHNFYWFSLEPLNAPEVDAVSQPTILLSGSMETLWSSKAARREFDQALANYVKSRRWFRSKARSIVAVSVKDAIPVSQGESAVWLVLAQVDFRQGDPETYCLPLALASGDEAHKLEQHTPQAIVARTRMAEGGAEGVLYDGVYGKAFPNALLDLLSRRKELPGNVGVLRSWPERQLRQEPTKSDLAGTVSSAEQSNTSLLFGSEYICKLLRKQDFGPSPELEIGRFLSARGAFPNAPELLGVLEYHTPKQEPATLATLHRYVAHQGDAWELTRNALERFYEQCLTQPQPPKSQAPRSQPPKSQPFRGQDGGHEGHPGHKTWSHGSLLQRSRASLPEPLANLAEAYPAQIRLLGQRTAELHQALSQGTDDPQFAPEPFNTMYQRSLYESTRTRLKRSMAFLRKQRGTLAERERQVAEELLDRQAEFDTVLRALVETKVDAQKIRVHGDYHLGQVLFTGKDFIIIDFEGEPGRTLAERRFKHCPLRDVASMVRSLDYAALSALRTGSLRPSDVEPLEDWARAWSTWMSAAFTNGYLSTLGKTPLLPQKDTNTSLLLDFYLLDKCLYELDYEFNNRPDWVAIPLFGLFGLLAQQHQDRKHQEPTGSSHSGSSHSGSSHSGSSHRHDEETNGDDDDAPSSFLGGVS
jgi:maltose alpha-D-glucosyltransferase/alpha-amylase